MIKAPSAARAPTWLGRVDRRELRSHFLEVVLNRSCDRMRAAQHAPRDSTRVLERRHGLAEIIERGGGVPDRSIRRYINRWPAGSLNAVNAEHENYC